MFNVIRLLLFPFAGYIYFGYLGLSLGLVCAILINKLAKFSKRLEEDEECKKDFYDKQDRFIKNIDDFSENTRDFAERMDNYRANSKFYQKLDSWNNKVYGIFKKKNKHS